MKNAKKLRFMLLCIAMVPIFFVPQLSGESIKIEQIYPKASYTITNNSICIDTNNESTSFDRGSGISTDPYILENKVVNISNGAYGIKIVGVNYVIIQNCTITAEESISTPSKGIYIENCDNATIYNNTIADIAFTACFYAIYIDESNSANITENKICEINVVASNFYGIWIYGTSLFASVTLNHIFNVETSSTIYAIETFSAITNISRNTLDHLKGNQINCIVASFSDHSYITWNNISRLISTGSGTSIRCFYNITSTNLIIENNLAVFLLQNVDLSTTYDDTNTIIHADADEIANISHKNTTELIGDHIEYLFNITYNYTAYLENPTYQLYLLNASDDSVIFNQTESFNGTNSGNIIRYQNLTVGTYYGYFVINETDTLIIPAYRIPSNADEYISVINIYPIISVALSEDKMNVIWTITDETISNPYYKITINGIIVESDFWDGVSTISIPIDNSKAGQYSYSITVYDGYGGITIKNIVFAIHEDGGIPDTENINIIEEPSMLQQFLMWLSSSYLVILLLISIAFASIIVYKKVKKILAKKKKEANKYRCPLCSEVFLSVERLDNHLIAIHGYNADYKSNIQPTL